MKKSSYFAVLAIVLVVIANLLLAPMLGRAQYNYYDLGEVKVRLLNKNEFVQRVDSLVQLVLFYNRHEVIIPAKDVFNPKARTVNHFDEVEGSVDHILDTIEIKTAYSSLHKEIIRAYQNGYSKIEDIDYDYNYKYLGFWEIEHRHNRSINFIYISNSYRIKIILNDDYYHSEQLKLNLIILWTIFILLNIVIVIFDTPYNKAWGGKHKRVTYIWNISVGSAVVIFLRLLFGPTWFLSIIIGVIIGTFWWYIRYRDTKKMRAKNDGKS